MLFQGKATCYVEKVQKGLPLLFLYPKETMPNNTLDHTDGISPPSAPFSSCKHKLSHVH